MTGKSQTRRGRLNFFLLSSSAHIARRLDSAVKERESGSSLQNSQRGKHALYIAEVGLMLDSSSALEHTLYREGITKRFSLRSTCPPQSCNSSFTFFAALSCGKRSTPEHLGSECKTRKHFSPPEVTAVLHNQVRIQGQSRSHCHNEDSLSTD